MHSTEWTAVALVEVIKFVGISGGLLFLTRALFKQCSSPFRISEKAPTKEDYRRELFYGTWTLVISVGIAYGLLNQIAQGKTLIYQGWSEHGPLYSWFSFFLLYFAHDTYFYWLHRLLHTQGWYQRLHLVHHRSVRVTPLTAHSAHPLETVLHLVFPLWVVHLFPIHYGAFVLYGLYSFFMNGIGHLGFELGPRWWYRSALTRWLNPSTYHDLHHQKGRGNFGLYTHFWDRAMGTYFADTPKRYREYASAHSSN